MEESTFKQYHVNWFPPARSENGDLQKLFFTVDLADQLDKQTAQHWRFDTIFGVQH